MLCEMCGKEVEATNRVRVEGSELSLCPACSQFGEIIVPIAVPAAASYTGPRPLTAGVRAAPRPHRTEERDLFQDMPDLELAPDWSKRIRSAREKLNWTPEELGKRLNEKKSVILKIESGHFRPPDSLVSKIEHHLRIRIRAEPEPSSPR